METASTSKQLNQNGARGIEENCELSIGLSRGIRRLSWISRSKELSVLLMI